MEHVCDPAFHPKRSKASEGRVRAGAAAKATKRFSSQRGRVARLVWNLASAAGAIAWLRSLRRRRSRSGILDWQDQPIRGLTVSRSWRPILTFQKLAAAAAGPDHAQIRSDPGAKLKEILAKDLKGFPPGANRGGLFRFKPPSHQY